MKKRRLSFVCCVQEYTALISGVFLTEDFTAR